jgi:hypothetical protein
MKIVPTTEIKTEATSPRRELTPKANRCSNVKPVV